MLQRGAAASATGTVRTLNPPSGAGAIERIGVRGFRTIDSTELRVGLVTALVGEANAGKSNLLAAIALLGASSEFDQADSAAGAVTTVGATTVGATTSAAAVEVRFDHDTVSRRGSWPVAVLPSALRATTVVPPSAPPDAGTAAVADAIRGQVHHRSSPGSRADGLVTALERCCEIGVSGVLLLIEEPELYLRPQAQRYLYRLLHRFAAAGNQVIYSTHAPAFLNVARLEELAVITRDAETGTTVHQAGALSATEGFRAMSEFDAERSELFLADAAVLVEGRTEKLALPHIFRTLGIDVDRAGISIVECGGKANLPVFVRLCRATGVPFVVVHDRDAAPGRQPIPSEVRLNERLHDLAGDERVVELAPDFEAVAGLRRHSHKPEQAWHHFRTLEAARVPDELRRVVELASAALGGPEQEEP